MTPSSCTRLLCLSCLQKAEEGQNSRTTLEALWGKKRILRHDRGLGDESLRGGVIFDTLDGNPGPPVVSDHDV